MTPSHLPDLQYPAFPLPGVLPLHPSLPSSVGALLSWLPACPRNVKSIIGTTEKPAVILQNPEGSTAQFLHRKISNPWCALEKWHRGNGYGWGAVDGVSSEAQAWGRYIIGGTQSLEVMQSAFSQVNRESNSMPDARAAPLNILRGI